MSRTKIDNETQGKIARAYRAGGSPTEIGKNYGISCGRVIDIAQRWETRQKIRKLEAMSKRHDRLLRMFIAPAPTMETPEPEFCAGYRITRRVKTVFNARKQKDEQVSITLPAVSMAFDEAMGRTLREAR